MREHPNTAVVRLFYEAVARGHRGDIQHLLTATCSLLVDGRHHLSGTANGHRAVADWFLRAGRFSMSGLTLTPLTIAAIGSLAVAVEHVYATSEDAVLSVDSLRVFDMADGRIERIRAIDLDAPAVARFWGTACGTANDLQSGRDAHTSITPAPALASGWNAAPKFTTAS